MKKNNYLCWEGVTYDLSEWLTTAEFVKKYKLKRIPAVNNMIYRGAIPLENVLEIPELNHLRLIKTGNYT